MLSLHFFGLAFFCPTLSCPLGPALPRLCFALPPRPCLCFALPCPAPSALPLFCPLFPRPCLCFALCFARNTSYRSGCENARFARTATCSLCSHETKRSLRFASMLAKQSERFVSCEQSDRVVMRAKRACSYSQLALLA